ncbi:MAG: DUF362 domain-containing protein [Candidatus Lokiarchaeota archaeon]|nr:DUF362 domain-containing protein [Candidatus Lokiarchaeota archaeon]
MNGEKKHRKSSKKKWIVTAGIIAIMSGIWLALRSGLKPSRITYPCQRAALSNIDVFKMMVVSLFPGIANTIVSKKSKTLLVMGGLLVTSMFVSTNMVQNDYFYPSQIDYSTLPIQLDEHIATLENPSNLYYVRNASGQNGSMDLAVTTLFSMLESNGESFYNSSESSGLISATDVIVFKVNAQWDRRGGTNNDLLRSLIQAILNHPDGFTGEIVICDNGQGYGHFDYGRSNAYNDSNNVLRVVESFHPAKVSAYLWDDLRTEEVAEFSTGDTDDGYVVSDSFDTETQLYVSYPKFTTVFGTNVSFKKGTYNGTHYDSDKLKVINTNVLKSHRRYGVTACVKNYMGLPMGMIVNPISSIIPHEHFSIALGGMGALMAEVRAPILNILDMIWICPHPLEESSRCGPDVMYTSAKFADIIAASTDPVALDYWSAKNVLCQAAEYLEYEKYSSMDPDYEPISPSYPGNHPMDESFHNYLNRSNEVLIEHGYSFTMDPDRMNVFITNLENSTTPIPTEHPTDFSMILVGSSIIGGLLVIAVLVYLRKK